MALEKQFGWLSSPSSEEESREKGVCVHGEGGGGVGRG